MTIVLLVYLAALLGIAAFNARRIRTVEDFTVAKRSASPVMVTGSLVATVLGGSAVVGAVEKGPSMGAATAWFMMAGAAGLACLRPLAAKVRATGGSAVPDLVGSLFGDGPRLAASTIVPVAWVGVLAAQVIAAARLLQSFTPLSHGQAATVSAIAFVLYTMAGGQLSVLRTDLLQAFLILSGLAAIAVGAVASPSMRDAAIELAGSGKGFPFNGAFSPMDLFILLLSYGTTFTIGPDMLSRVYCARSPAAAERSVAGAAATLLVAAALIGWISLAGATLGDAVPGARITFLAKAVLPAPALPAIALALASAILSSADTTLLGCAVIVERVIQLRETSAAADSTPGNAADGHCPGASSGDGPSHADATGERRKLRRIRLLVLFFGCISLAAALRFNEIIEVLLAGLSVYAGAFTAPIVTGLVLGGRRRFKEPLVMAALLSGGALALTGKACEPLLGRGAYDLFLLAAFAASLAFMLLASSGSGSSPPPGPTGSELRHQAVSNGPFPLDIPPSLSQKPRLSLRRWPFRPTAGKAPP